jgi:rhodanese-related sulfurtransferase
MNIKSSQDLVNEAEIRELWKEGTVMNSKHIPRGMLEFWLDPQSSYYKEKKFDPQKKIILFCALGMRSALATKSLVDMGFKNVAHVKGGFESLKRSGFKIVTKEKK